MAKDGKKLLAPKGSSIGKGGKGLEQGKVKKVGKSEGTRVEQKIMKGAGSKGKGKAPSWANDDEEEAEGAAFEESDSEGDYEEILAKRSKQARKKVNKEKEEDGEDEEDEEDEEGEDSENDDDDDDSDEDSDEDDDAEAARRELADVPFEVLQQLQRDGSHVARRKPEDEKKKKKEKAIKGAPVEQSSKTPVGRFRNVVHVHGRKGCDPRFERLSGSLNEDLFCKTYSFVADKRKQEIMDLKEALRKTKDSSAREALEEELGGLRRQEQLEAAQAKASSTTSHLRKAERKLVEGGKKPFFLKKSDQRILDIAKRYEELKGSKGKVEEAVAKRRKKNAQKDHRYVPYARRSAGQ